MLHRAEGSDCPAGGLCPKPWPRPRPRPQAEARQCRRVL